MGHPGFLAELLLLIAIAALGVAVFERLRLPAIAGLDFIALSTNGSGEPPHTGRVWHDLLASASGQRSGQAPLLVCRRLSGTRNAESANNGLEDRPSGSALDAETVG